MERVVQSSCLGGLVLWLPVGRVLAAALPSHRCVGDVRSLFWYRPGVSSASRYRCTIPNSPASESSVVTKAARVRALAKLVPIPAVMSSPSTASTFTLSNLLSSTLEGIVRVEDQVENEGLEE